MTVSWEQLCEWSRLADELTELIDARWKELGGYDGWLESKKGLFSDSRARQIGEQLNRVGGFNAMQTITESIHESLGENDDPGLQRCFLSDINWAWDGIGQWRC